jgi:mannose-1-phosphate guanylyltransferase
VYHRGLELAVHSDVLVTIGIKPDKPETGYGYIRRGLPYEAAGEGAAQAFEVRQFVEKPNLDTAQSYLDSGEYFWNSGMFIWRPSVVLSAIERFLPETLGRLKEIVSLLDQPEGYEKASRLYEEIQAVSVDVGVMERAENVVMLSGDSFRWSDVGSWSAWTENEAGRGTDEAENIIRGDAVVVNSKRTAVVGGKKLIAVLGVQDLIIVDSDDALLVCHRDSAQDVKKIVDYLKEQGRSELL